MNPTAMLRRALLGAALLAGALPGAAQAQAPLLYEQRLPDGTALIRFVNALPGEASIRADFAAPFTQGAADAERVGPYVPAEKVTGRPVALEIAEGGETLRVSLSLSAGYNTVILARQGGALVAASLPDALEFNQIRARLAFYNAIPGCADGSLTLQGSNQPVFANVAPNTTKARSVNPAAASVRAACGGRPAAVQDLGRLEAGGQYSVWLMAPAGSPVALLARDRIAPRR